ncbi:MAG: ATP synthase F0 subunit C [Desulfobacterales bacterium]
MQFEVQTVIKIAAYAGGGLAMGFGAIGAAIGEGYTAARANQAISRNPELSGDIFKNMLVGQAVAESSSIFALVIAILLLFMDVPNPSYLKAAAFLGGALCMGFGAIGSGVGSGYPGAEACFGIAQQPKCSSQLTTNMLIGSAVCQTPAIFSMVVALMLIFIDFPNAPLTPTWAAFVGAGFSGIGNGAAAQGAVRWVARNVEASGDLMRIMLVGQAVSQSTAIYAMVVSLVLIFVV